MIKHGIPVMLNFLASAFLRVRSVNKVFIDNVYQILSDGEENSDLLRVLEYDDGRFYSCKCAEIAVVY